MHDESEVWIVGILRFGEFHALRESPAFPDAQEAKYWALKFLKANPGLLLLGVDCLQWRRVRKGDETTN